MNIFQRAALRLAGVTIKDLQALHPEAFTRELLYSGNADQAKDSTPQTSNAYDEYASQAWVFKATSTVARSFRSVPLYVMRGEDWIEGHPIEKLLAKPNPAMSGSALWERWIIDVYLAGETGIEVTRNKRGEVAELWPRQGRTVTIDAASSRYMRANGYTIKDGSGDPYTLTPEEFIWSWLYNPLSVWRGLGVYQAAALGILTDKQAQRYAASFFRGMARPDYVVTTPQGVTQTEKDIILAQIEAMTSGRNRGIVMEQGITDIKPLSFAPKDLIWETIRAMTREEIGAVAGVPGELMGDKSATYENRAEAVKSFWNDTIRPLAMWRDEYLTEYFRTIKAIRPDEAIESDFSGVEALEQSYADRLTYATQLTALGVTLADANEMFDLGIPDASLAAADAPEPEPPVETPAQPALQANVDAPQKRYKYEGQPRDEQGRFGEGGGVGGGGGGGGDSGGLDSIKPIDTRGLPGTQNVKPDGPVLAQLYHASRSGEVAANEAGAMYTFSSRKDAIKFAEANGGMKVAPVALARGGHVGEVDDFTIEAIGYSKSAVESLRSRGFVAVVNKGDDVGKKGEQWLILNEKAIMKSATKALTRAMPWPAYGSEEHKAMLDVWEKAVAPREARMRQALKQLFAEQEKDVLRRLNAEKALTKSAADNPFDLAKWIRLFRVKLSPHIRLTLAEAGRDAMNELNIGVSFDVAQPEVLDYMRTRENLIKGVVETTFETLKADIQEGIDAGESIDKIAARVQERMGPIADGRATMIARTEVIGASNGGKVLAWQQSGVVTGKRWLASTSHMGAGDPNPVRDSHVEAHGQEVGINEPFTVGNGEGLAPGQIGLPEEDINCRCTMLAVTDQGRGMKALAVPEPEQAAPFETRQPINVTVSVAAPVVNVSNQQPAPVVNVAAAEVNIPEQPAPVVNVSIPEAKEQPAPVVNVSLPRATSQTQTVNRDEQGNIISTTTRINYGGE